MDAWMDMDGWMDAWMDGWMGTGKKKGTKKHLRRGQANLFAEGLGNVRQARGQIAAGKGRRPGCRPNSQAAK
jgi:hypothetical protein